MYNADMNISEDWFLPHPRMGVEWWYFTGLLNEKFGFEITVFMSEPRMLPMSIYFPFVKSFLVHFTITDLEDKCFVSDEWTKLIDLSAFSRNGTAGLLNLNIGGVSLVSNGTDYMINARSSRGYMLSLLLSAEKKPVMHGKNGIINMGTGDSYYYSLTGMRAAGIMQKGSKFFEVSGSAWHDHQFGNFEVSGLGWEWFSLRFTNKIEIMAFLLRDRKGKTWKYMTIVMPDGTQKSVPNFNLKHIRENKYPEEFQFEFSEGSFTIESMLENQIIKSKIRFVPEYAEMLCRVKGRIFGEDVNGYGYTEIVK